MNKIIISGILCLLTLMSCKEDATKKIDEANVAEAAERDAQSSKFPILKFNKTEYDFGEIEKGKPVQTVFSYKNEGDAPLVITDIKSSCGCTVPEDWSREPLAPGKSGKFTVKYNASGSNKITKTITVSANTEKGSEVVTIKAFVKDSLAVNMQMPTK